MKIKIKGPVVEFWEIDEVDKNDMFDLYYHNCNHEPNWLMKQIKHRARVYLQLDRLIKPEFSITWFVRLLCF